MRTISAPLSAAICSTTLGTVSGIAMRAPRRRARDQQHQQRHQPVAADDLAGVVDQRERLAVGVDQDAEVRFERGDDRGELIEMPLAVLAERAHLAGVEIRVERDLLDPELPRICGSTIEALPYA